MSQIIEVLVNGVSTFHRTTAPSERAAKEEVRAQFPAASLSFGYLVPMTSISRYPDLARRMAEAELR